MKWMCSKEVRRSTAMSASWQSETSSNETFEVDLSGVRELVGVELPCLSKDSSIALKCLGGKDANLSANHIYFNFPHLPEQGSALLGVREPSKGLLLKFTRDKRDNSTTVDVVGRVNHMFTFTNPGDFQLIPHDEPPLCESSKILRGHFPTFVSNPFPNIFVDSHKDIQKEKFRNKAVRVKFGDPIPMEFPHMEDFTRHPMRSRGGHSRKVVEEFLDVRPICVPQQLYSVQRAKKCRKYSSERVLVLQCYSFIGGPWNGCWVRYGHDPAQDPLNRIWQVSYSKITRSQLIKIRNRIIKFGESVNLEGKVINLDSMSLESDSEAFRREYEYAREITLAPIVACGNLIKGYFSVQLGHVFDEDFMRYVTSLPFSSTINAASPSSGFFTKIVMDDVRRTVRSLILRKLDIFCKTYPFCVQPDPYTIENMHQWKDKYEAAAREPSPTVKHMPRALPPASAASKKRKADDATAVPVTSSALEADQGGMQAFEVFGGDSDGDDSEYSSDDMAQYMEREACYGDDKDDEEEEEEEDDDVE